MFVPAFNIDKTDFEISEHISVPQHGKMEHHLSLISSEGVQIGEKRATDSSYLQDIHTVEEIKAPEEEAVRTEEELYQSGIGGIGGYGSGGYGSGGTGWRPTPTSYNPTNDLSNPMHPSNISRRNQEAYRRENQLVSQRRYDNQRMFTQQQTKMAQRRLDAFRENRLQLERQNKQRLENMRVNQQRMRDEITKQQSAMKIRTDGIKRQLYPKRLGFRC